jgi:hypothetical protein
MRQKCFKGILPSMHFNYQKGVWIGGTFIIGFYLAIPITHAHFLMKNHQLVDEQWFK